MTQDRFFNTFTDEQTLAWFRHHIAVMHGNALALAQKAGLSPVEAAGLFGGPCLSRASFPSPATEQILERQAKQIAGVFALTHAEPCIHVEHQGNTWLITAMILDREALEHYSASLECHTHWMAE